MSDETSVAQMEILNQFQRPKVHIDVTPGLLLGASGEEMLLTTEFS